MSAPVRDDPDTIRAGSYLAGYYDRLRDEGVTREQFPRYMEQANRALRAWFEGLKSRPRGSEAYTVYVELLVRLYELRQSGPPDSAESNQIRSRMDALWLQLTPWEQEHARRWKTTIELRPVLDPDPSSG